MPEHVIAQTNELNPGDSKLCRVGRVIIALFRIGDEYYALPNLCTHQLGPLCTGKVGGAYMANAETNWSPTYIHEGEVIACPWHGLEFHITTGQCLAYPNVRLRRYPIKIDGNDIKLIF